MKKLSLQNLNFDESNRLSAEEKRMTMGGGIINACYGGEGTWCLCGGYFICIAPGTPCSQLDPCPLEP